MRGEAGPERPATFVHGVVMGMMDFQERSVARVVLDP